VATTAQLLSEAQAAYHRLVIGKSTTVVVGPAGERVEYARADAARLAAYIASLQAQVAAEAGAASRGRGPLTFMF
jgi:hypothetical protein